VLNGKSRVSQVAVPDFWVWGGAILDFGFWILDFGFLGGWWGTLIVEVNVRLTKARPS
jgi:hypothetical protein